MFTSEVALYGLSGEKAQKLKEIELFDRILDVYITAGVVGLIYNKKGIKQVSKTSVKIFAGQLNAEALRIKYLSSLTYLIENSYKMGNEENEKELLRETFGDWFGEVDTDNEKKYKLFELYALGGIDILYDKIIGDKTNKDRYYENFKIFIDELSKVELTDDMDRAFAMIGL